MLRAPNSEICICYFERFPLISVDERQYLDFAGCCGSTKSLAGRSPELHVPFGTSASSHTLIKEAFAARGLPGPQESVRADVNVRIHLLATGRFVTIFPESLVQSIAGRWSIKTLPIDLGIRAPPVGIVTLKNRTLSPVVQLFIDAARDIAKSIVGKSRGY